MLYLIAMIAAGGMLSSVFFMTTKPLPQISAVSSSRPSAISSRFVICFCLPTAAVSPSESGLRGILSHFPAKEKLYTPGILVYHLLYVRILAAKSRRIPVRSCGL